MRALNAIVASLLVADSSAMSSFKIPLTKKRSLHTIETPIVSEDMQSLAHGSTSHGSHDTTTGSISVGYTKKTVFTDEFQGAIYIGTPGQQQNVTFDSGSGVLIATNPHCTNCNYTYNENGVPNWYDATLSTTSQESGLTCLAGTGANSTQMQEISPGCPEMVYGSLDVNTQRYRDTVCFGGELQHGVTDFAMSTSQCVPSYPVFSIMSFVSGRVSGNGIIGLTPTCSSQPNCSPLVVELYHEAEIKEAVIAFNLGENSPWNGLNNMESNVEIGGYNMSWVDGEMQWMDAYDDAWWAPQANGMYYNGMAVDTIESFTSEQIASGKYKKAIFDTGTTYMALPQKVMNRLEGQFEKAARAAGCQYLNDRAIDLFVMQCTCTQAAPYFGEMEFIINGNQTFTLTPLGYLQEHYEFPEYCIVAITEIPESVDGIDMYLLGGTFLRHFYTVFNYTKNTEDPPAHYKVGLGLNCQYWYDDTTFDPTCGTLYHNSSARSTSNKHAAIKTHHPGRNLELFVTGQLIILVFSVLMYLTTHFGQQAAMKIRASERKKAQYEEEGLLN